MTKLYPEMLSDQAIELVHDKFYELMSVEHAEDGATCEVDYDFEYYTRSYDFNDMLMYVLTH